ncbi:lactonase family protein [Tetragenococcus muriaticus]|uniref:6-phosphogluconolactonase n=2 Tax=Tetragenococcus muriaticus TaxID=64642 RepID=A0A091C3F1_9ENTE|nr:lactonase family protein [Tetragenococcus muriaticus]KFN90156.1 6-phosphogluconolactonase [Tetragenococcus muriaticus PMC-11-5]KFN92356.1 6-phosphogluconolactonase [Tetragenococcus muriaticus 3MR10-3]GMA47801.1 hypothetical protein GCM10025854_20510 [Tetragenococcus muriaticus]
MIEKILLGTYTRGKSRGIYSAQLDTENKNLSDLALVAQETSPTYLAKSKTNYLYNVTTVDDKGGVAAYDPSFNYLNAVTEEGAPLCYIAVDNDRQLVYGANYHKGEVNVYQILADGSLKASDAVYHDEPTGPHENQDHAHAHYANLTPDNRLAVCDLGTDRIYTYNVSDEGKLTEIAVFEAPAGTGPRHLTFHPNEKYAYLFGELDSTVTILSYDKASGQFNQIGKISTLPEDYHDFNGGAAIRITSDGKFLYVSNRGHNSITVFTVNNDGDSLSFLQNIASNGDFPRDFNLDPTEQFIVCGHQKSDNLSLFERNEQTGELKLISSDFYAPECVCVLFD